MTEVAAVTGGKCTVKYNRKVGNEIIVHNPTPSLVTSCCNF